jgi:hypothetical protein
VLTSEVIEYFKKLERRIRKQECCNDCVAIDVVCENGEVPVWNSAEAKWECGESASGGVSSISEEGQSQLAGDVTLSEGAGITLTQTGQDIEISSTPVTLNADTATQNALNLSGQEIQVNPATSTEYGVVRLSDVVPTVVANFAALPDPTTVGGKFYWAEASQGTKFIGALWGGTYYPAGLYYSNSVAWLYMDTPAQATQVQVDAGIVTNQFVSPATHKANLANTRKDTIGFTADGGGSAIATGKVKGYFTYPSAATITGWNITLDTGTCTIKVWKVASGTAVPTAANSINTSGVAISSGTAVHSAVVTDFTTTAVSANDIFAYNIEALSGATELSFNLELTKT